MKRITGSLRSPWRFGAPLLATCVAASVTIAGGIYSAAVSASPTPSSVANPAPVAINASQILALDLVPRLAEPAKTTTTSLQLPNNGSQYQTTQMSLGGLIPVIIAGGVIIFVPLFLGGLVVISEREVGIVVKKFTLSGRGLPAGRLVALDGEAGYQADTLAPGWHWGYWPWQYSVRKESLIVVPQGEIALLVAADGAPIPPERLLGKVVPCDNFQDARKFLTAGGEKGRQLGFLTAGTYRINTALFKVMTAANANAQGMKPEQLQVYSVAADKVGIVTTLDGMPIPGGEIAGPIIPEHDNFQNGCGFDLM